MGFSDWVLRRKKKLLPIPYRYCEVVYSNAALRSGILDDYLKKIVVKEGGVVVESYAYTPDVFEAFKKFMPAYDRTENIELAKLPILVKDDPSEVAYEED